MFSSPDGAVVGLDIGGTSVRAGLVSRGGQLIGPALDEPRSNTLDSQVTAMVRMLASVADGAGAVVRGAGMAIAGSLSINGRLSSSPTAPQLVGINPRDLVSNCEVLVTLNDADAAMWAEGKVGAAANSKIAIGAFLGTGVGGSIMIDGQLFRGATGIAGEIGHLVMAEGPACGCGGRGCLEQYASGPSIVRRYVELAGDIACDAKEVGVAARAGDEAAMCSFRDMGSVLGRAMATLINVVNPDAIVLGGGLSADADLFLPDFRMSCERHAMPLALREVRVSVGRLGRLAGVIGAGMKGHEVLEA